MEECGGWQICVGLCLTAQSTKEAVHTKRGQNLGQGHSGGDQATEAWGVRDLDFLSCLSVLPRAQGSMWGLSLNQGQGIFCVCKIGKWKSPVTVKAESWCCLAPGGDLLLCRQIGSYRLGSVSQQQVGV